MFRNKFINIALILIIAIALLGVVGFVAYKMFVAPSSTEPKIPTAKELVESQYEVGKMTTNLAGGGIIQATFSVQGEDKDVKKELEERKVQVKDIINSVLHTTTLADIQKPDGIERLKLKIIGEMNKVMLEGKVTNLYISDIVTQ
jgi:flagellar FliL protein